MRTYLLLCLVLLLATPIPLPAQQRTAITYQGELYNNGQPVDGNWDFRFVLYSQSVGGAQLGQIDERTGVLVSQGIFTTEVDFGTLFSGGADQFVEIAARAVGTPSYAILSPRQRITAAPKATALALPYADIANSQDALLSLTNTSTDGIVMGLYGNSTFATMDVRSNGAGAAIYANAGPNSAGSAIRASNDGIQRYVAEFEQVNPSTNQSALFLRTFGAGGAALQAEVNSNTQASAISARTTSNQAGSYAGAFTGPVRIQCAAASCNTPVALAVVGTVSKSAGTFRIDHPLDPEHKYLSHSFVESPDMKNLYDGVALLDARGEASVRMPDWFEALNRDLRYQLTAIGAPAPHLHVAAELRQGTFRIAGGVPGGKVSWQLTGTRQDAYARAYPTPVEEDKPPQERGRYLVPEVFGKPESLRIGAEHVPPLSPPASPGG